MTGHDAITKADKFIALLLEHQPGFLPAQPSVRIDEASGQRIAQALAALRKELIAQLQDQP